MDPTQKTKCMTFFNAWMDPGSADYIVSEWGYGHGNQTAMTAIGAEGFG
jgi:spermidine/putrescine transport system substrate-binding protein